MMIENSKTIFACMSLIVILNCLTASAQEKNLACGDRPDLLRNEKGKVVWLKPKELSKRATCRDLTSDQILHGQATIVVIVLINPKGEVECAKSVSRSEFFAEPAVKRARNWKFKPMEKNGKSVAVYGLLVLNIKYGSFSVVE